MRSSPSFGCSVDCPFHRASATKGGGRGTWWREHRPAAPGLFVQELSAAIESIASRPDVGTVHAVVRGETVRRVLLPESEQHVYYAVDPIADVVTVYTVWGARRGRSPKL